MLPYMRAVLCVCVCVCEGVRARARVCFTRFFPPREEYPIVTRPPLSPRDLARFPLFVLTNDFFPRVDLFTKS